MTAPKPPEESLLDLLLQGDDQWPLEERARAELVALREKLAAMEAERNAAMALLREWDLPIVPIEQAGTGIWRNDWNERRQDFLASADQRKKGP